MSTQTQGGSASGTLLTLVVLTLIVIFFVWYANQPTHRTVGQRIDDLIGSAPHTVDRTAEKLEDTHAAAKASAAATKVDATLKKTGDAASSAAAEIGADIKAAINEQKKQNAAHKPDKALTSSASSSEANDAQ